MTYGQQLIQKGVQQGVQQGMQQGMQQGFQAASEGIARDMIVKGFEFTTIQALTKLPQDIIARLAAEVRR